ncbi:complement component C8 gamma chain isoform X2 [Elgaria multicarinata webbii]|uniref:complement component C8 gamma chain isoform X2 n=1 Tax=Elgaria multicarinata webbii TaxID=159646 RepID=UPI002FCCFFB6
MEPTASLFLLLLLVLASPASAQRRKKPPARENPIDKVRVQANFNSGQFVGKWFLVGVASRCNYLSENSNQLEATNVVVSVPSTPTVLKALLVDTFRPLPRQAGGRRGGRNRLQQLCHRVLSEGPEDLGKALRAAVSIQSWRRLLVASLCESLEGRTIRVSQAIMGTFERHVAAIGMNEDVTFYFPVYGFCDSADEFHLLDETKYTGKR